MTAPLIPETDSLRKVAAHGHLLYGTAIGTFDISVEQRCSAIVRDCSLITPEYEMKWNEVAKRPGAPDYRASDRLVAFALQHEIAVHGHTLWWHEAIPDTFRETPDGQFAEAALQHLRRTVSRYGGRLHSWDVINEPLAPDHGRSDGLRHSRFLEVFGTDYIGMAYREAAALDPHAILVLNEMAIEYATPESERKRRMTVALLERELAGGAPIGCLGIQSHLIAGEQPRHHPEFRAFLREIDRMGLGVMITEMDVSDALCPRDIRERDRMVADTYRAHIELVLEENRVLGIGTWGLSDDRSWLHSYRPRADRSPLRPLPLDRALRRKPAWHAIRAALLSAGLRPDLPRKGH